MSTRGRSDVFRRARKANDHGDVASLREALTELDRKGLSEEQRAEVAQWEARIGYDKAAIALTVIGGVTLLVVAALIYM